MHLVNKSFPKVLATAVILLMSAASFNAAQAVPKLQIYIEGSFYNPVTETWVAPSANGLTRLWVIGTPGKKGGILDVELVAAYGSANGAGTVSISANSSTIGGFGGYTDPSTPGAPTALGESTSGTPAMNSGALLPPHSPYGTGLFFQTFDIGDFTLLDSPNGDFISGFPTASVALQAQINVYEITISGVTSGPVHFDAYGTYDGRNVFAPFSHDGEAGGGIRTSTITTTSIPEPETLLVLGLGFTGLGIIRRRRKAA